MAEQIASVRYGIPTTHWAEQAHSGNRTRDHVRWFYDQLDPHELQRGAVRALADHGRRPEYPMVHAQNGREKMGVRDPFTVRSCNLLPGFMSIPVLRRHGRVEYVPLAAVERTPYAGEVYSLDVPTHHHYISDGLVTHNCFYSWKEGAAHQFFGPANVTDLWHVKKISPQSMVHLTEKPVELAVRAMQYSSRSGENVLDLFGGSGSTLIAAQQTGRRAFLMEIDPAYCDVIVQRWERFTERKAERIGCRSGSH
jgi:hypothetical protein